MDQSDVMLQVGSAGSHGGKVRFLQGSSGEFEMGPRGSRDDHGIRLEGLKLTVSKNLHTLGDVAVNQQSGDLRSRQSRDTGTPRLIC